MKEVVRLEDLKLEIKYLPINSIVGYVNNTRTHSQEQINQVKSSISEFGMVNPIGIHKNVILSGHCRWEALKQLDYKEVPTVDLSHLTEAQKKAYIIADNKLALNAGWNEELLKIELESLQELDFDLDLLGFDSDELDDLLNFEEEVEEVEENEIIEKNEIVEAKINEAWKMQIKEFLDFFYKNEKFMFISKGLAKIKFLEAKHYKKEYPRYLSLAFHPQQIKTPGDKYSTIEGLEKILLNEINVERLRFVTGDDFSKITKGSLAFAGAKMPLDFPVSLASSLIKEFGKKGNILDPCHGWGARLIGSMLEDVEHYTGVDASDLQNKGVKDIFENFKEYSNIKDVNLINSPFEKVKLKKEFYDFALTSPPYFDREKYIGGEQSHSNYSNYDIWKNDFYDVLIKKVYDSLKADSYFALQVGSQVYPLAEDGKLISKKYGFEFIEMRDTCMKNNFNETDEENGEVVLIFYKRGDK